MTDLREKALEIAKCDGVVGGREEIAREAMASALEWAAERVSHTYGIDDVLSGKLRDEAARLRGEK
jgi:hypothetical protein